MLINAICLICFGLVAMTMGAVRYTNLKCKANDPPFADFKKCELNILRRGIVAMNVHVELFQVPVSNVTLNVSLNKLANGYHPFLYNMTTNFCTFMRNRSRLIHFKLLFDLIQKVSNINHTCPYAHDIIVSNWVLEEEAFRYLPLPDGEYALYFNVAAYNDWKAEVKGYFTVKGDFGFNKKWKNN